MRSLNIACRFGLVTIIISALLVTACGKSETGPSASGLRVAFVYQDKVDDYSWSYLHEIGRQYLLEKLPDVETKFVDGVTVEQVEQILRELSEEGYQLIFATAPDYSDAVLKVAAEFPDTKYEVCRGD